MRAVQRRSVSAFGFVAALSVVGVCLTGVAPSSGQPTAHESRLPYAAPADCDQDVDDDGDEEPTHSRRCISAATNDAPEVSNRFPNMLYDYDELITSDSPSDFFALTYKGVERLTNFDYRVGDWDEKEAHLFKARFRCARPSVDITVDLDYDKDDARKLAARYAKVLGQMPYGARRHVNEMYINGGDGWIGAGRVDGRGYVTLNQEEAARDIRRGTFEEALLHEMGHASIQWWGDDDLGYVSENRWKKAVKSDDRFVSDYATESSAEDVAESYVAWIIWNHADVYPQYADAASQIGESITDRLRLFEAVGSEIDMTRSGCPRY